MLVMKVCFQHVGQRTAEAARGLISEVLLCPNKQLIYSMAVERKCLTEKLPMPRNGCQESMRNRTITVELPHWYSTEKPEMPSVKHAMKH